MPLKFDFYDFFPLSCSNIKHDVVTVKKYKFSTLFFHFAVTRKINSIQILISNEPRVSERGRERVGWWKKLFVISYWMGYKTLVRHGKGGCYHDFSEFLSSFLIKNVEINVINSSTYKRETHSRWLIFYFTKTLNYFYVRALVFRGGLWQLFYERKIKIFPSISHSRNINSSYLSLEFFCV